MVPKLLIILTMTILKSKIKVLDVSNPLLQHSKTEIVISEWQRDRVSISCFRRNTKVSES